MTRQERWGMMTVFLMALSVYAVLSMGPESPFNAHVRLAEAWLSGQVTPPLLPPHIEHAPGPNGAIIPYGPGPSLLLLPFVALGGLGTDQSAFCMALGALNVALMWSLAGRLGIRGSLRTALTVLFGLGSPHLFMAVQSGNSWPMMHVVTVFGLLVALRAVFAPPTLASGLAVGLGLGLAYLTRQPAALAVPFVALMGVLNFERHSRAGGNPGWPTTRSKAHGWVRSVDSRFRGSDGGEIAWRWLGGLSAGLGACVAFALLYNWARMGNPLDSGYERVIRVITPPELLPHGVFSLEYLLRNLHAYFLSGPVRLNGFPYFLPSQYQMSMLLVFPALLLMPLANWRKPENVLALGAIAAMMAVYLVYYWTGATQFGMRYAVDWLPFAMLLLASAAQRKEPLIWFAAILGMAIEAWGLVLWRMMGWN